MIDPKQFLKEVGRAKETRFAIDNEEYILGVRAIAAPIRPTSHGPAAIWVVGFTSTLDDRRTERVVSEIQKTAQEINHSLQRTIHGGPTTE